MELPDITFTDHPRVVFWEATKACNQSCKYCRASSRPSRHPNELDTEEVKDFLKGMRTDKKTTFIITGGDPLKRPDITEILEFASDKGFRTHLALSSLKVASKDLVENLSNVGLSGVSFSIDRTGKESREDLSNKKGRFERTLRFVKICEKYDLSFQVNTTVTKETIKGLPGVLNFVKDLGAPRWSLFFLVPTGRGQDLSPISAEREEELLNWLSKVSMNGNLSISTTEAHHFRRVMIENLLEEGENLGEVLEHRRSSSPKIEGLGINDGNGVMFISHTGTVYPSGFLPVPAGSVRNKEPLKIYRSSDVFKKLRDKSLRKGKCGGCEFLGICGGSRAQAYAATDDYLAADPTCVYEPGGVTNKISELSGKEN